MAKIFLDANYFIDIVYRDPDKGLMIVDGKHELYISVLSVHIYCYSAKIKLPNKNIEAQIQKFSLVDLTKNIIHLGVVGPTKDLEDNIQLHSAAEAECDFFLTFDRDLLDMKFFGKTQLVASLPKSP